MASLTEVAYQTRRSINWAIVVFISYFVLRFFWGMFVSFWLYVFPPKAPPPNHAFGKLPALQFPQPTASPSGQLQFTLETINGGLPVASASARVYFMPKAAANLLAISKTQEFAKQLGFDPTPIQETRTIYRFNDKESSLRKLRYDIVSNNFILSYQYQQDTSVLTEGEIRDSSQVIQKASEYLDSLDIYTPDFKEGSQTVTLLSLVGNKLVPVQNLSQTYAMRVDFFRQPVTGFKLMTPHPDEGQIQLTVTASPDVKRKYIGLTYTYWPIDYQTYATYKIKPVSTAWQELQNGQGYIAHYPDNNDSNAVIRTIYIAYYDSFDPQNYLQPIWVFEGDHNMKAYVSAVDSSWTE
jgi:hypothetical protein